MLHFLCKTVLHRKVHSITIFQSYPPFLLSLRCLSATSKQGSFTVSYLVKTCGLSKESASTASKRVCFKTPERPDSVMAFFKSQGFSKTQITRMIKTRPALLMCDAEKTFLPKFEFLGSKGFSSSDLVKFSTVYPTLLMTSLENQIIPVFNFISKFLQSDEMAVYAIKRLPRVISYDVEAYILPNINFLRNMGVPQSNIVSVFRLQPQVLLRSQTNFKDIAETVKNMGFNPMHRRYLSAIFVYSSVTKSNWEKKIDTYKKFGWSEEVILKAFCWEPYCMLASVDKITAIMHFLVNELGFKSSDIAKYPRLVLSSFTKKILPRGLFAQDMLSSKGVVKNFNLGSLFLSSEEVFINKFVNRHEEEASKLLKLYQEKLDLSRKWKPNMEASAYVES